MLGLDVIWFVLGGVNYLALASDLHEPFASRWTVYKASDQ
jgi:hypothetical protein